MSIQSGTVVNMSEKQKIWGGRSRILRANCRLLIRNVQNLEEGASDKRMGGRSVSEHHVTVCHSSLTCLSN